MVTYFGCYDVPAHIERYPYCYWQVFVLSNKKGTYYIFLFVNMEIFTLPNLVKVEIKDIVLFTLMSELYGLIFLEIGHCYKICSRVSNTLQYKLIP